MSTDRQATLKLLLRAIALSDGDFALLLARCNSIEVRERLVADLKAQLGSGLYDRHVTDADGVVNLVDILDEVGEGTQVINVTGLKASPHLHDILALANNAREEFRKRFKFPLVLWVTDEVESQLRRQSPDLASWAAPPFDFALDRAELQAMLERETADVLDWAFAREGKRGIGQELQWAWQEWKRLEENRSPELAAKVALAFGIEAGSGDAAREHFENCLAQVSTGSLAAAARYRLGLWWQLRGKQERVNFLVNCDRAREQLQMAWHEVEGKQASVALALGEILLALALPETGNATLAQTGWQALANFAKELVILPDWAAGLRAEVAIARQDWQVAKTEAEKALQGQERQGFYLLSLGRSLIGMDRAKEAIAFLEQAKALVLPKDDPDLHIRILKALHRAYTESGNYQKAFKVKCDRESVETSYGFRAFIGAGRLQPQRRVGAIGEDITEIAASGRQADIDALVDRVKRDDCRLTVVHGYSGVGKSSLLQWGLVPALKNEIYRARHILPVVVEQYDKWEQALAKELVNSLKELAKKLDTSLSYVERQESNFLNDNLEALNPSERLLSQLRRNDRQNLITVLIFDQFEEFFFKHSNVASRRKFYDFLKQCLDTPYVWIILSLREDYVHYLLEYDRLYEEKENNVIIYSPDILKTDRRYPIGNFDRDRAKAVIKELTERSPYRLEDALIDRLVADLAAELGEVRPIELQVVGAQMLHGDEKITTLAAYEALGDHPQQALVKRWLTQIVQDCGQENKDLAEKVLYALTDEKEKRPAKTQTQLKKDVDWRPLLEDSEKGSKFQFVLDVPIGSGLAFKIPTKPEDCYRLIHDYLVPPIRQQFDEKFSQQLEEEKQKRKLAEDERDELRLYKSLEEEKQKRELVEQELTKSQLNEERQRRELVEQELVGKKLVEQKNRLLSRSLFFSAMFATALGISSVIAFQKKGEADLQEKIARGYAVNSAVVATSQTWQGLIDAGAFNIDSQVNTIDTSKRMQQKLSDLTPDTQLILKATLNRAAYTSKEINRLEGNNRLEGHKNAIKSIAVVADGKVLTGSFDKTAKLWNHDGKLIHSFDYGSDVSSGALSSDGKKVLIGSWDKPVTLWKFNIDKWEQFDFVSDASKATSIAFSPDGKSFITASVDGIARLWSVDNNNEPIQSFNREGIVRSVAFSPDGKTVLTGSDDKTAKLWSLDGQLLRTFTGHDGAVISLAFSSDGKVITGSEDQTAKLWNIENGQLLVTFKGHGEAVTNVAFGKEKKLVFTGSEKGRTAKLWNMDGRLMQTLRLFSYISSIAFSLNRNTILAGSINNTVKVFKINQQQIISDNLVVTNESNSNANNNTISLKITGNNNNIVELRNFNEDKDKLVTTFKHSQEVTSAVFSPDGKTVLTSSKDQTAKLWKLDGSLLRTFKDIDSRALSSRALSLDFSPDHQKILIGYVDATARLWNLVDGSLLQTLQSHSDDVWSVAFSPDGKNILTGSADRTIKLWSIDIQNNTNNLLYTFQGHIDKVVSVAFDVDVQQNIKGIKSESTDRMAIYWDLDPETSLSAMCNQLRDFALGIDDPSIKGEKEKAKLRDRTRKACNIPPPKQ